MKDKDKAIIVWLESEIEYSEDEAKYSALRARKLKEALGRFRKTKSLPREVRKEFNQFVKQHFRT